MFYGWWLVLVGLITQGLGTGSVVIPPVLQSLITAYAWRDACRWFALIILVVALPSQGSSSAVRLRRDYVLTGKRDRRRRCPERRAALRA